MEKEFEINPELIQDLKALEHPPDKIDFLDDYLKNTSDIPLPTLAFIYESLGDYYRQISHSKPTFYKKAGSIWEIISALKEYNSDNKLRRMALFNAFRNYKKAQILHKKANSISDISLVKQDMEKVKHELYRYGGPLKQITLVIIFSIFILSFLFIVSTPTGLITSEIESRDATMTGFALAIISIIIMVIVIKKWK